MTHAENSDLTHVRENLEKKKVTDVHSVHAWTCPEAMLSPQVPCLQLMLMEMGLDVNSEVGYLSILRSSLQKEQLR